MVLEASVEISGELLDEALLQVHHHHRSTESAFPATGDLQ